MLALGYIFVIGSIVAAVSPTGRLAGLANGAADVETAESIVRRLLPFATAGFLAIAGQRTGEGQRRIEARREG